MSSAPALPSRDAVAERDLVALETRLADRPLERERLLEVLTRASARRVERVHLEPDEGSWRLRWRHDDALEEHRLADGDALPEALVSLAPSPVRRVAFTARLDGARHVVTLDARSSGGRETYVLTLHGRALAPPRLDALVDDAEQLRLLRRILHRPVGWIPIAAAGNLDGMQLVRAFAQELASPERKLLCVEPPLHPPLARVTQLDAPLETADLSALDPDAVFLADTPADRTLVALAAAASERLLVVQRLDARRPSEVVRRLLALGLAPAWIALAVPAIVMRHRVRPLCLECRVPAPSDCDTGHWLGTLRAPRMGDVSAWLERSLAPRFAEGEGCAACAALGGAGVRDVTDVVVPRAEARDALLRGDVESALRRVDADGELAVRLTAMVDAGTISAPEAARHLTPRY